jgi:hypothetical protein
MRSPPHGPPPGFLPEKQRISGHIRIDNRWQSACKTEPRMAGYPSVDPRTSEFRIEKARTHGTLRLSSGASIHGSFFVADSSARHAGPERIKDILNSDTGFFPFEVRDSEGAKQTILYNREHVIFVELLDNHDARLDPGYLVATRRTVAMLFSNGIELKGAVSVYRPQGHDRLSDFARSPDQFSYLESAAITYLVNVRHVIELIEENS